MHAKMTLKVIRANIIFFDSNPIGRILTRFSTDFVMVDLVLSGLTDLVTRGLLRSFSVVASVSIVNPFLLIPAGMSLWYCVKVMKTGTPAMVEGERFEKFFRGPINNNFFMVTNGLVTLRAYRKFDFFRINFMEAVEKSANSTFGFLVANRWLGVRLDGLCIFFGVCATAFAVFMKDHFDREYLTFSLQIVTDIVVLFSVSVRLLSEIQSIMTGSQRIYQYTLLDSEDELNKAYDKLLLS